MKTMYIRLVGRERQIILNSEASILIYTHKIRATHPEYPKHLFWDVTQHAQKMTEEQRGFWTFASPLWDGARDLNPSVIFKISNFKNVMSDFDS